MAQVTEPVEAVIISGSRKGEIVHVPEDTPAVVSEEDIKTLNKALDDFIAAIERVSAKVRAMTEELRNGMEAA